MEEEESFIENQKPDIQINNDLSTPCHTRKIPLWLVLIDNIPTLVLIIIGIVIINHLSSSGAVIYAIYAFASILWFWAKICPHCHYYGTQSCPCGYGVISAKIFNKNLL